MLRWLERKLQIKAVTEARSDIERFVWSLKGQPDGTLGMLVAYAAVTRLKLMERGVAVWLHSLRTIFVPEIRYLETSSGCRT